MRSKILKQILEETPKEVGDFVKAYGLLKMYTDFLLEHGYCDTDVYEESPTAIDRFIKTLKVK